MADISVCITVARILTRSLLICSTYKDQTEHGVVVCACIHVYTYISRYICIYIYKITYCKYCIHTYIYIRYKRQRTINRLLMKWIFTKKIIPSILQSVQQHTLGEMSFYLESHVWCVIEYLGFIVWCLMSLYKRLYSFVILQFQNHTSSINFMNCQLH
jgi:hypothetical protein